MKIQNINTRNSFKGSCYYSRTKETKAVIESLNEKQRAEFIKQLKDLETTIKEQTPKDRAYEIFLMDNTRNSIYDNPALKTIGVYCAQVNFTPMIRENIDFEGTLSKNEYIQKQKAVRTKENINNGIREIEDKILTESKNSPFNKYPNSIDELMKK